MTDTIRRLLLVRHAQGSLGTDDYDRLSPLGKDQAGRLGQQLRSEARGAPVVRGGLRRHRETAERIAAEHAVDPALDEYRVDHLLQAAFDPASGLGIRPPPAEALADPVAYLQTFLDVFPDVLEAWQGAHLECPVNGSWTAFDGRVQEAGQRLVTTLEREPVVTAVTSAGVISTMTAALLGRALDWQRELNVALYNASVTELHRLPDGRWRAERINCVNHLPVAQHTLA
jgi:broad specificity phosphatase PhoE